MAGQIHVAIIGAGLAGLTLAHALHDQNITFDVYDARDEPKDGPKKTKNTSVLCTPNTLRVLDYTGAYEKLKPLGYSADTFGVLDKDLNLLSEVTLGGSHYGYSSLRVSREMVVDALRRSLIEKGAGEHLHWNARFQRVVSEGSAAVEFELDDGSKHSASLLIGADGIYSRVRSHITETIPSYTGVLAPIAVLDGQPPEPKNTKPLRLPSMVNCSQGGFVISPQGSGDETIAFRHMYGFPDLGRKGWEELGRDGKRLVELLQQDMEQWPEYVQEVMKLASPDSMTFWPFHEMPDLPSWHSPKASVVLIGDVAHAVPPSSAQGAAQAVEDGYSLGMVLAAAAKNKSHDFQNTLEAWQEKRMERIRLVQAVAKAGVARKLSEEEQKRLDAGEGFAVEKLYEQLWSYHLRPDYESWISERVKLGQSA